MERSKARLGLKILKYYWLMMTKLPLIFEHFYSLFCNFIKIGLAYTYHLQAVFLNLKLKITPKGDLAENYM